MYPVVHVFDKISTQDKDHQYLQPYQQGIHQQPTKLKTFVSGLVPGNKPITGVCSRSNNRETAHWQPLHKAFLFFVFFFLTEAENSSFISYATFHVSK